MAVPLEAAKAAVVNPPAAAQTAPQSAEPVIIDLGRKRRRLVKELREGRGKLMTDINTCIQELRDAGTISETAQPVIVIVRQKRRNMFPLLGR
jgi:hypothetical protein